MNETKFDTDYQDDIICPGCGKTQSKGSEYEMFGDYDSSGPHQCGWGCGAIFTAERHISVSYSTELAREETRA